VAYYLLDLERTIGYSRPFFWKRTKFGYTSKLEQAGLFSKEIAEQIVDHDHDRTTVMISKEQVIKILGKDMEHNENIINIIQP
jgi:hypothetical protein